MNKTLGAIAAAALTLGVIGGLGGTAVAKDSVSIGMRLEPAPGLDPTTGAAAAIGQVTGYNVFEGLTRLDEGGGVHPLLAKSWDISGGGTVYTFHLEEGVTYHDGADFDSADVVAQYARNAGAESTNKFKAFFQGFLSVAAPDPATVVITMASPNSLLPFQLGQAEAVILDQESYAGALTNPIGTGPYKFIKWTQGDSVDLAKYDGYRNAADIQIKSAKFRFIGDATAQAAALLSGDLDYMPNLSAPEMFAQFENDDRFTVLQGTTEGETILAMNNKRGALQDVRVRRALQHAIDREALIIGAVSGYGTPIGSHFPPHHPAYLDLTGVTPFDQAKARALLAEAGYGDGLELSLHLPPPSYARRGGEIIAAMLAEVGVTAKIENVEWPGWLDTVFGKKAFDLTIVSHVEPMDMGNIYSNPDYYFQYDNQAFRDIIAKFTSATDVAEQTKQLQAAQRKLADDAVNGFLFENAKLGVAQKGLTGLWASWPAFINDIGAMKWEN